MEKKIKVNENNDAKYGDMYYTPPDVNNLPKKAKKLVYQENVSEDEELELFKE